MSHLLGMHWFRTHPNNPVDFDHIHRMGYKSFTIYNNHYDNQDFCRALLEAAPSDAVFLLRDQPMSEEKSFMYGSPASAGDAHAKSWAAKFQQGKIFLPANRCWCLGINEPDSNQYQRQINIYFSQYLKTLERNGMADHLKGGWGGFGVGHPSTVGLVPTNPVDWSYYKESAAIAKDLGAFAISHEYWMRDNYNWGNWCGRFQSCPYDLKWIIQEGFIDSGVVGKFPSRGWQDYYTVADPGERRSACDSLNYYQSRISRDPRVHSFQPFCYDENLDWKSFDIRPLAKDMESYPWTLARDNDAAQVPIKPTVPAGSALLLPVMGGSIVTQRFGENPADYARFGIPGHNGVDYGAKEGTPVVAIADGKIAFMGEDNDYGTYIRMYHPHLGFHSFYAHLSGVAAAALAASQNVKAGTELGYVGHTGNATGPHLHLELRLANADGSYAEGQAGYGKGRVDPQTVYHIFNHKG